MSAKVYSRATKQRRSGSRARQTAASPPGNTVGIRSLDRTSSAASSRYCGGTPELFFRADILDRLGMVETDFKCHSAINAPSPRLIARDPESGAAVQLVFSKSETRQISNRARRASCRRRRLRALSAEAAEWRNPRWIATAEPQRRSKSDGGSPRAD